MAKRKETEFEKLARLIKEEGEDIRTELGGKIGELGVQLGSLDKKMDTGFARVDQELGAIRAELKSIRADLNALQDAVGEHDKYTKEIDHILQRVAAIEKHLRLKPPASVR